MLNNAIASIKNFFRNEEGASAVEYGLIIGLIAVALVVVLGLVAGDETTGLQGLFQRVVTAVAGV